MENNIEIHKCTSACWLINNMYVYVCIYVYMCGICILIKYILNRKLICVDVNSSKIQFKKWKTVIYNFDLLRCRHNILPLNTLACITWEYNLMVISKISVNFQVIMFFIVFLLCFYYFGEWWYHFTFYVCMCEHIFYYSWVNTLEWDCWILWKVFV